jgi:hypothetical protein
MCTPPLDLNILARTPYPAYRCATSFMALCFRRDQSVGAARDHLRTPASAGAVSFRWRELLAALDLVTDL